MGRTLESVGYWHWNLSDPTEGYSGGAWQHDDHELLISKGGLREVTVAMAGFQPLQEDARRGSAWIGITRASGLDLAGQGFEIDADPTDPLSWPRALMGEFLEFRVSMVVFHASAGFEYAIRTYD
jgi:hypothetical protein